MLTLTFQKIPAHKFAIIVASEVFEKEFAYGDGTEDSQKRSKALQVVIFFKNDACYGIIVGAHWRKNNVKILNLESKKCKNYY